LTSGCCLWFQHTLLRWLMASPARTAAASAPPCFVLCLRSCLGLKEKNTDRSIPDHLKKREEPPGPLLHTQKCYPTHFRKVCDSFLLAPSLGPSRSGAVAPVSGCHLSCTNAASFLERIPCWRQLCHGTLRCAPRRTHWRRKLGFAWRPGRLVPWHRLGFALPWGGDVGSAGEELAAAVSESQNSRGWKGPLWVI